MNCKFCGKECKNANSLRNHERLCKLNLDRQYTCFQDMDFQKNVLHKDGGNNQFIKAARLGLPSPEISGEVRKKISEKLKLNNPMHKESTRRKVSETINAKVASGTWHTSLAKNMHIDYNGSDLHGKWEYAYAKYLDSNNIEWVRASDRFEYFFNGKYHFYTPDFYLVNSETFVEIKGYKTAKDDAKWEQFPKDKNLVILRYNDLLKLGII